MNTGAFAALWCAEVEEVGHHRLFCLVRFITDENNYASVRFAHLGRQVARSRPSLSNSGHVLRRWLHALIVLNRRRQCSGHTALLLHATSLVPRAQRPFPPSWQRRDSSAAWRNGADGIPISTIWPVAPVEPARRGGSPEDWRAQ